MSNVEAIVKSVLANDNIDLRPFILTIETAIKCSFAVGVAIENIKVRNEIYPMVASSLEKNPEAVAKQVERTANRCWDKGNLESMRKIMGNKPEIPMKPKDTVIYFAAYAFYGIPYRQVIGNVVGQPR